MELGTPSTRAIPARGGATTEFLLAPGMSPAGMSPAGLKVGTLWVLQVPLACFFVMVGYSHALMPFDQISASRESSAVADSQFHMVALGRRRIDNVVVIVAAPWRILACPCCARKIPSEAQRAEDYRRASSRKTPRQRRATMSPRWSFAALHSARIVSTGSSREALRAGSAHAATAATIRSNGAATNVSGSRGPTL